MVVPDAVVPGVVGVEAGAVAPGEEREQAVVDEAVSRSNVLASRGESRRQYLLLFAFGLYGTLCPPTSLLYLAIMYTSHFFITSRRWRQ